MISTRLISVLEYSARYFIPLFVVTVIVTGYSKTGSEWIQLFDGNTLKGWHSYGQKVPGSAWAADSGTIHLRPGAKLGYQTTDGGDLITDDVFDNFMLELEWKVSKSANSGLIFYVEEDTMKYKETWHTGFEVQVCDNEYNVDAHVFKRDAGAVYDLVPVTKEAAKGHGEWNKVEMTSNNGKVDIRLNGIQNISFNTRSKEWKQMIAGSKFKNMPGFGLFKSGHIALQDHGQEVWFRNIRVKRL